MMNQTELAKILLENQKIKGLPDGVLQRLQVLLEAQLYPDEEMVSFEDVMSFKDVASLKDETMSLNEDASVRESVIKFNRITNTKYGLLYEKKHGYPSVNSKQDYVIRLALLLSEFRKGALGIPDAAVIRDHFYEQSFGYQQEEAKTIVQEINQLMLERLNGKTINETIK